MGYLDVLLDATLDTLKILPILLLVYLLIEFLEYKRAFRFENSKLLRGKASPLMGALFGSVPQCGFSIISTDLYTKKQISIGALIAAYIATSDEALPIMIADYHSIPALIVLILTKIVFAIIVGYVAMLLYKAFFNTKTAQASVNNEEVHTTQDEGEHHEHAVEIGCCHHEVEPSRFEWKHPIVHTLKILLFVFIVNIIMGTVIYFWGEENLSNFLTSSYAFQPLFAVLVGLIPNCAASVVLTELFVAGSLSFGAVVAGLSVNAGLGILLLLKQHKKPKEILFIFFMLIIPSLILGYALHYVPINLMGIIA